MRHWERLKLRRGGGKGRSRYGRGNPTGGEDRGAISPANQFKEPKHGTTAEISIALFTLVLLIVAWRQTGIQDGQLDLSEEQFSFTQDQAKASAKETAAALNVSQTVASATADQARAMKQMAEAADKQATAAKTSAEAAVIEARSSRELVAASVGQMRAQQAQLEQLQTGIIQLVPEEIVDLHANGQPVFGLTVRNVGNVPVTLRAGFRFTFEQVEPAPAVDWSELLPERGATRVRVAPRQEPAPALPIPFAYRLTEEAIRLLEAGEMALRVRVVIEYTDSTGKPKLQRFCQEWHGGPRLNGIPAHFCPTQ